MLDHADRGDRVELLAAQLAVVHDPDLDLVSDAVVARALPRPLGLRLAERDPGHVHAVALRRLDGERAPATADVEHALAGPQAELAADRLALVVLRVGE